MGTVTFSNVQKVSVGGNNQCCLATLTGSSRYSNPGGDLLDVSGLPFAIIDSLLPSPLAETSQYIVALDNSVLLTPKVKFSTISGTITGGTIGNTVATNGTSAVTGTGTFTPTAPTTSLDLTTPAFSGTGLTASGQVITTTSTHTMSANQCAGMWLISATGATPPNLILSNTAVAGAAAVLTVQGAASTDAGAYKIVKNVTQAGTVSALSGTAAAQIQPTHTHSLSGLSGSAAISEVANDTDLSAVTQRVLVFGRN